MPGLSSYFTAQQTVFSSFQNTRSAHGVQFSAAAMVLAFGWVAKICWQVSYEKVKTVSFAWTGLERRGSWSIGFDPAAVNHFLFFLFSSAFPKPRCMSYFGAYCMQEDVVIKEDGILAVMSLGFRNVTTTWFCYKFLRKRKQIIVLLEYICE